MANEKGGSLLEYLVKGIDVNVVFQQSSHKVQISGRSKGM